MDRLPLNAHGRFLDRLGVCGVRVAGICDIFAGGTELHRDGRFGDHRAGNAGDAPDAEHPIRRRIGNDFHKAVGFVIGLGAAVGGSVAKIGGSQR